MRVTNSMQAIQIANNLQQGESRLNTYAQEVSTGKQVTQPSDNPLAAEQILALQGTLTQNTQYATNISMGTSWLSLQDSALSTANNVVTNAQQLATQLSTGTFSATDRLNAVSQVQQIQQELISLGNTQVGNQYIFGGTVTNAPPYDASGNYGGNDQSISVQVDGSTSVAINNSGDQIFGNTSTGTGLMQTLTGFITALQTNNIPGIQNALAGLNTAADTLHSAQAAVGAKENLLTSVTTMNNTLNTNLQQVISNYQDVDIAQASSNLAQAQTAFQAALQSTAMVEQLSLVNFIS